MFSDCLDKCSKCRIHFVGGCIAGHGDDDFQSYDLTQARKDLENGWIKDYKKDELKVLHPQLFKTK